MKNNFCTLFNSYYLTRGITLYDSLVKQSNNFHLYIFAFDNQTFKLLNERNMAHATIISLKEFEDERLLSVKADRSIGEYCWTCTGATIKYCLEIFSLESCTYLDADLYFFNNPQILLNELPQGHTLITEHRYTKKYDQTASSGKYCVQFMTFHKTQESMKALNWWIDSCIDWCYAKAENGKFGDQKYLDDWTERFENIHVLKHLGGGVAPWNVQQYTFYLNDGKVFGTELKTGKAFELIFFHFHALQELNNNQIELSTYELNSDVINLIYAPYVQHLHKLNLEYNPESVEKKKNKHRTFLYLLKRIIDDKSAIIRYFRKKLFEKNNIYPIESFTSEKRF